MPQEGAFRGHFFVNFKKIARTGHIVKALLQHLEGTWLFEGRGCIPALDAPGIGGLGWLKQSVKNIVIEKQNSSIHTAQGKCSTGLLPSTNVLFHSTIFYAPLPLLPCHHPLFVHTKFRIWTLIIQLMHLKDFVSSW